MALIKCPDCGKKYSDRADSYPNCYSIYLALFQNL